MPNHTRPRARARVWNRFAAILAAAALAGPATAGPPRKASLAVESIPSGALVSVHLSAEARGQGPRIVAGETPLERPLDFGKGQRLWLEVERRGFEPQIVEVTPTTGKVAVTLVPLAGEPTAPPAVTRVAVVPPEITVIRRGFSKESRSEEHSEAARAEVGAALRALVAARFEVVASSSLEPAPLRALWRDARTAMEMLDPIRLPYLGVAPRLETRSAREAARSLGEALGADALFLADGKQNEETGGMRAAKVGIMVGGTAASFASGYSRAIASGDSLFTYNVYIPSFAEGLVMRAVLIHCASGEVIWLDKGLWPAIEFDRSDQVHRVAASLLASLGSGPAPEKEEEP